MAAPHSAASKPTSLLWAHKLQIEHGYLLQRMQTIENKSSAQDTRLADAENLAQTTRTTDVANLASKVKAINDANVVHRIDKMERNVEQRLDSSKTESRLLKMQIADIQNEQSLATAEREAASNRHRELLQQISHVEEGLTRYEQSLERMGKLLDPSRFEQIKNRCSALAEQVRIQGEGMMFLPESIRALQASNSELKKAVAKNEAELRRVAAERGDGDLRTETSEVGSFPKTLAVEWAEDGNEPPRKKKKSHKWSGGGADREIIRSGSDLIEDAEASSAAALVTDSRQNQEPQSLETQHTKKGTMGASSVANGHGPEESTGPKVSTHRTDEGVSEDNIEVRKSLSPHSNRRNQLQHFKKTAYSGNHRTPDSTAKEPTAKAATVLQAAAKETILRSGKGWFDVPSKKIAQPATEPSVKPPVRGAPGRAPKATITPLWNPENLPKGRSTRRVNYPPPDMPGPRKKNFKPTRPDKAGSAVRNARADESIHLSGTADSQPQNAGVSLQTTSGWGIEDGQAPHAADTVDSSPPPPRRTIVQSEDLDTFLKRING